MKTINPLVVAMIVFFCGQSSAIIAQDGKSCEVQATIDIDNSSDLQSDKKATIRVLDGQTPFKYLFYDGSTGRLLQKDFSRNSIDLKKGSYYCVVADNRGCIKKIQFQIQ